MRKQIINIYKDILHARILNDKILMKDPNDQYRLGYRHGLMRALMNLEEIDCIKNLSAAELKKIIEEAAQ